ncbi:MAG TPA: Trm112 family protein [Actinomycetales bacterium]|nr:Trm112 family protein [Actinomycetales bacterium]
MNLALEPWVRQLLRCPVCHGELTDREAAPVGLDCAKCQVVYPVEDGIPVLLEDEARSR